MKTVTVKRKRSTTYTLSPKSYCTHCGERGVYEDDDDDYYTGCGVHCFRIECGNHRELNNLESLGPLLSLEPVVVDSCEFTVNIDPFDLAIEEAVLALSRVLSKDIYGDGT